MAMDAQDQNFAVNSSGVQASLLGAGILGSVYLAVLPMAGTIALRNVALLGLLIVLLWQLPRWKGMIQPSRSALAWAAYLLVFPWIAVDHQVALQSLSGQWGRSLLAIVAGAGLAALLRDKRWGRAFHLGVLSSVPILTHLIYVVWRSFESGGIPWGYWGRETHHADLGFAAGQAVILLSAGIVAGERKDRALAITLILVALLSTVIARSRAGFAYAVFGAFLIFFLAYWRQKSDQRRKLLGVLFSLLFVVCSIFLLAIKDDPRWRSMVDKLDAGFLGNALQIECEGTGSIESTLRDRYKNEEYAQQLISSVHDGDGARMVVLRAGLKLSLDHPWGSDGSREAFRKLLLEICPQPVAPILHAHNGWIDTLLAIGWLGAFLYFCLLMAYLRLGISGFSYGDTPPPWAFVLVGLSIFWLLRGLTDSVYRDHMLEMQCFVLAYAAVAARCHQEARRVAAEC